MLCVTLILILSPLHGIVHTIVPIFLPWYVCVRMTWFVYVQVNSDGEAMVEVVDGWLARLYPNTPTWREIADVVEQIGHHQLSQSIKQVHVTGGREKHCQYIKLARVS